MYVLKTGFIFSLDIFPPAGVSAARKRDVGQRRLAGSQAELFPPDWGGARAQRPGGGHDVWRWRRDGVQQLQRLSHPQYFLIHVLTTVLLQCYCHTINNCFDLLVFRSSGHSSGTLSLFPSRCEQPHDCHWRQHDGLQYSANIYIHIICNFLSPVFLCHKLVQCL